MGPNTEAGETEYSESQREAVCSRTQHRDRGGCVQWDPTEGLGRLFLGDPTQGQGRLFTASLGGRLFIASPSTVIGEVTYSPSRDVQSPPIRENQGDCLQ